MKVLKQKTNSESNLWINFVNGNQQAFGSIYRDHMDALYAYGFKIYPDKDLISDCIQDTFIDLFERKENLSNPSNIKFYLFKVLKHTILRKLKRERKFVELSMRKDTFFQTEYCLERKMVQAEKEESKEKFIFEVINTLTLKQKEILYLRFSMGFDYVEISEIVNIDQSSVRKQVYRAIKKIRESESFKEKKGILFFIQFPYFNF